MGQRLLLNIIPNNFTVGTGRKVWCDRGMRGEGSDILHYESTKKLQAYVAWEQFDLVVNCSI